MTKIDLTDKQLLENAHDLEITRLVSNCIAELKRRALLSKSYVNIADALVLNASRNAATRVVHGTETVENKEVE